MGIAGAFALGMGKGFFLTTGVGLVALGVKHERSMLLTVGAAALTLYAVLSL